MLYLILFSQVFICFAPVASCLFVEKIDVQELSLEENFEFEEEDRKDKKRELEGLSYLQAENIESGNDLYYSIVFASIHHPEITTPPPREFA